MKVFNKVTICATVAAAVHLFSYSTVASNDKTFLVKHALKDANASAVIAKAAKSAQEEREAQHSFVSQKPAIKKVSKLFHITKHENTTLASFRDDELSSLTPAALGTEYIKKNPENSISQIIKENFAFQFSGSGRDRKIKQNHHNYDIKANVETEKSLVLTSAAGKVLLDAIEKPKKIKWENAYNIAAGAETKEVLKLLQWLDYKRKNSTASFEQITDFIVENPEWPAINTLRKNAEKNAYTASKKQNITDWFTSFAPISIEGKFANITSLIAQGNKAKAKAEIARVWKYSRFTKKQQKDFLNKFGKYISKKQHVQRVDNLLWQRRATEAKRILYLLDKDNKKLARARIALILRKPGVDSSIRRVPKKLQNHPGLIYERAVWRKRSKQYERTADFIKKNPTATKTNPQKWWRLRKYVAMKLLEKGKVDKAYELTSNHNMAYEGVLFADAEWLSGWIALRFKKDDRLAFNHFETLHNNVSSAVSKSRGAYWSGIASEKIDVNVSNDYLKKAAFFSTTFYGQLAAAKIGDKSYWSLPKEPAPSETLISQVKNDELIRVVAILDVLGQDRLMKVFVRKLYDMAETPEKVAALAEVLGGHVSRPDLSVVVARRARMDGIELTESGYPIVSKEYSKEVLEKSLTLAVVRQESSFQVNAVSSAKAYGIMQLIPSTAKRMSKHLGLDYSTKKLKNDPIYNMTLGSNYLKKMVKEFDGSYVLAIAAYNAGPSRVKKWVKKYGDPRKGEIAMIDWIEAIPYSETQNYVQRVVENLKVYRRLFGDNVVTHTLQGNLRSAPSDEIASNEEAQYKM
ncbi:MAG: lytic transglycosylase domain-containing protein [Alphaproteobacteria bacterium]|nr:lytic transglycosylase domain-containing protein [Alphaproteobacteria bacterium]